MSLSEDQLNELALWMAGQMYHTSIISTAAIKGTDSEKIDVQRRAFTLLGTEEGMNKLRQALRDHIQHSMN